MTILNVSSLVPSLMDIIMLVGIESSLGCFAALKMSLSFFPSLTKLCCGARKMFGMNCKSQDGRGMTELLHSSLFMVL